MLRAIPILLAGLAVTACASDGSPPRDAEAFSGVYAVVLGTAQDAGVPQVGCEDECCRAAWNDPARRRLVSSLLVADARSGERFLFDATLDFVEQIERARGHPPTRDLPGPRPPLVDGVFLTHAHMGHYAGLLHLGREAYGASGVRVYASERMGRFLTENAPWSALVASAAIELVVLRPGFAVALADGLTVTPVAVPHREEFSDTLAFVIRGPERALLFLPDIDKWERWGTPIEEVIAGVDVALLDGTFHADGEIPGRAMADIPHPFIAESLARFEALPAGERAKILFTHLNHTNPAADPSSAAARSVRAAGMGVARDGMVIGL